MKKFPTILACASLVLFGSQVVAVKQASAASLTPRTPSQDGNWDNQGKDTSLTENYVGYSADAESGVVQYGLERSAITFNLSDISDNVTSAKLRIYITMFNDLDATNNPAITLVGSTVDTWSTSAFPMNAGDSTIFSDVAVPGQNQWMEFDVTNFVKSQMGQDKVVTFALLGKQTTDNCQIGFASDSYDNLAIASTKRPQLVLETGPAVPQKPSVSAATTKEDTKSTSGLQISPDPADIASVQYYKISNIVGGRLYKSDGQEITNNTYITTAEGNAGLKFLPNADKNSYQDTFTFDVQASTDQTGTSISPVRTASILVTKQNDAPTAVNDTLAGQYLENAASYEIPFADLTQNDSVGPNEESLDLQKLSVKTVSNASKGTVSIDSVKKVVVFTPSPDTYGAASFQYTVEDDGYSEEPGAGAAVSDPKVSATPATVNFTIQRTAGAPTVTSADLVEDSQSTSGLKITPSSADTNDAVLYKITGITGGTLYKNDGQTPIANNSYITKAEGDAGLKFTPNPNVNTTEAHDAVSFQVQAAFDNAGTGLGAATTASITVHEKNDQPTAINHTLTAIQEDSGAYAIPFANLLAGATTGPANESGQALTISAVDSFVGGTAEIQGTDVIFTPDPNYSGTASLQFSVADNGTTSGAADPKTAQATASFAVNPVAETPTVSDAETLEDHKTINGLVIAPSPADGTDVLFYKISSITGGTLYLNDGSTVISEGQFIPAAEGEAGLKFLPNPDANSAAGDTFSFNVQASLDDQGTGISGVVKATITVDEANDDPIAVNDNTLPTIPEDAGVQTIPFADLLANDATGPANESGQTLTITDVSNPTGGTVSLDSVHQTVIFTPDANYSGSAHFTYTISDNGTTNSMPDAKTSQANAWMVITSVPDVPSVTPGVTAEDTQSMSGLQITPNDVDGMDVTRFRISDIKGGTLYKNDGSSPILDGSFITVAEGAAGLKFTPDADLNSSTPSADFSFKVQAAMDDPGTAMSEAVTASIKVTEGNDDPVAANDSLTSVAENSGARTISSADLLANDSAGPADETVQTLKITSVGNAVGGTVELDGDNVMFTPAANFRGTASFDYTVEDNGTTQSLPDAKTATATVSFTVDARSDAPTVTDATTEEDQKNADGLVITPTMSGGAPATYFKITDIKGGNLYLNDGQSPIADGEYITVADGGAGLKFLPDADANGATGFGFKVQAAPNTDGTRLSDAVQASVTVTEVNDTPLATDDTLEKVAAGTPEVDIPVSDLLKNDATGPANESGQTLSVVGVSGAEGGTVTLIGSVVKFQPDSNFRGQAKFTYTVTDNGQTNGLDDPKMATADVKFTVADENQPVITLSGGDTVYVTQGQPYVDPGYSAYDDEDKDLTNQVDVTGSDSVDTNVVGTYLVHYNVADSSGNHAPEVVRTVQVVSDDLASLSLQSTTLTPAFDPGKTEYTASVSINTSSITLTPGKLDASASVTVNGKPLAINGKSEVKLNPGKNDIYIVVTAQGGATKTYHLVVTRQLPAPSNGNPGGDVRHADVDTGKGNGHIVQVDITRTQGADGHIVDSVVMNASKAEEVVQQAATDGGNIARIVIDDVPGKPADQVDVNVSGAALGKMKSAKLGLVIEAGGTKITLSADTLSHMGEGGEDLYFRVVPVRKQEEKKQVEQRVLDSKIVKDYVKNGTVQVVAQPMTIETNYSSHKTEVMLPLTGITLPTDAKEREAFLRTLVVYVEHSDGEKVVENGTVVYDQAGNPVGLEIEVQKFSTFTVISANVESKTYEHYLSGYEDGTFRPNQSITRAELASILAHELKLDPATAAKANHYPDVADSHWASTAILELRAAGILMGDVDGKFRPDDALTRAEIAVIVGKLKKPAAASQSGFSDTNGHWASSVIDAVKQAGLMSGYEDGTFRPDQTVTRAEAVVVVNRMFERPLLKNQQQATWPDVSLTDWYAADVESASNDLRAFSDGRIEKIGTNEPNTK